MKSNVKPFDINPPKGKCTGSPTAIDYARVTSIVTKCSEGFVIFDEMHEYIDDRTFDAIRNAHKVKR